MLFLFVRVLLEALNVSLLFPSVSVKCPLCGDGLVNADRRLILQADHHGYEEEELAFEWQLYFIADGALASVGKNIWVSDCHLKTI